MIGSSKLANPTASNGSAGAVSRQPTHNRMTISRMKRLHFLLRLERLSGVRHWRPSDVRQEARRLQPSASMIPTRPSRRRGRRRLREQPGTPRASRKSVRLREGLRGFVPRACPRDPSAALQPVRLRFAAFACRRIAATVRRLVSPFSFSRFVLVHLGPNLRPRFRVLRPASSQNRSPRTFANFVHTGSRQSIHQRSGTRSSAGGIVFAESFGPLRFECGDALFECRDSFGGFFSEYVRPVLHDAQSPGRNDVAGNRDRGGDNQTNLFRVKACRSRDARSIASFTECNVAGRTGNSGERFSKARRLRKGDQLFEFRRPSATPKKKTAAVGSVRLAAFGQHPCIPCV